VVTGQKSAAVVLFTLIDQNADEAAIRAVMADRTSELPKYFFVEDEINGLGYTFLQADKVEQAITMFRINVELFPSRGTSTTAWARRCCAPARPTRRWPCTSARWSSTRTTPTAGTPWPSSAAPPDRCSAGILPALWRGHLAASGHPACLRCRVGILLALSLGILPTLASPYDAGCARVVAHASSTEFHDG